ncbi:TetR/AcrR family transcriptional regulator [Mangrovicoccus ximenensis]|uniref:TetR/AcrR family transcriptional regulator n=1 Tax=Mangrovicoccus ximenensis TaxID=1911570 RepID=UPI000D34FD38|nr:TetR/AcrR family transcriptional regulator [Mangrovicoccus ximenensis]
MAGREKGIQSRQREETVARILAAAERVFADCGYGGGSISRIAAEAGVPKSNVVYYFETKAQLYRQVVSGIFETWRAAADRIRPGSEPLEALADYIDVKLELARARPHGSRVWANEIIQGAPMVQDYLETELKAWTEDRIAVIELWIAEGRLRPVSPRHLLYAIWAATQHYADFARQIETLNGGQALDGAQWDAARAAVKDLLLEGLRPR